MMLILSALKFSDYLVLLSRGRESSKNGGPPK
jgi:hypothetical protein